MFQEPWLKGEMAAVLQGGFLLADKLCQTGSLSAVKKDEWSTVGRPIIDSLNELLSGQGQSDHTEQVYRRKKILCVIWSKLLEKERGKDVETSWKENALFSVLNQLPGINRTVLFEVVKSMDFYKIYVELLLCLQQADLCLEVEHLVQYITTDTTPEDAQLLLEVWKGLWRGGWGGTETFDSVFADQFTDAPSQAPKRAKLDPETSSRGVIFHLFQAVREIKDDINSFDLCCFALSNCLDSIYTSYLLGHQVELSARKKLERLSVEVALAKQHERAEKFDLVKVIFEAQKDLTAVETPSKVKPAGLTLAKAMQTVICLLNVWEEKGLLKLTENWTQTRNALVLKTSLHRILQTLDQCPGLEAEEGEGANELKNALKKISECMVQNEPTKTSFEMATIAMMIIDHRLEGFQQFIPLFVADLSWSLNGNDWISCLERNKNVLKQRELVMKLVSILIAKCQTDEDIQNCRRLKDLVVDLFCELSTTDKNDTLVDVIALSKKGLHGHLPQSLTAGFSVEINLAFNCIIQGRTQSNSDLAVSAIARVAFQNPEATLRQCCHLAVVNLGAHIHLSKILKRLSGLGAQPSAKEGKGARGSLLCQCLQETVKDKLTSSKEQEQFLQFLGALMEPSGDSGLSFVPPYDVFQTFVFPFLSSPSSHHYSLELCLKLLHNTLVLEPQDGSSHWVMDCSPFPLLYCLCQLLNDSSRCWEVTSDSIHVSMESKEVLMSILSTLGKEVGKEVAAAPSSWSRALFWLYNKVEALDWTVRFHLKALWENHFKNEVPSSLLEVCDLPEQEWSGIKLDKYGQGTGLLAWLECCSISDAIQNIMLDHLSLDQHSPETVSMFSKGLLLVLSQTLPWCTLGEWARLVQAVKCLLTSGRLHVPYSLEYAEFLPLLDLRAFACELRLSVLLLRVFQLLCGSSCADWLPPPGWAHVARLYASTVRETLDSLKAKLPADSRSPSGDPGPGGEVGSQEVLFVLTQLFCHVMHVHVMMQGNPEPLFLCALEILTLYETTLAAHPKSRTSVEGDDTRHFLKTITDNLDNEHMKSVLQQKITQL